MPQGPFPTDQYHSPIDRPAGATLPALFEAQARATPDATALVHGAEAITYADLDRRADHLAHRLRAAGVGRDVFVGVFLERSPQLVVALLGVLKAGGTYLPLDPGYPPDRLAFMLRDAAPAVVVGSDTSSLLARAIAVGHGDQGRLPLLLQFNAEEPGDGRQGGTTSSVDADDLAYVIYTSGSSGQPKGVLVEHRGLVNLLESQRTIFGIDSADRVLQFASPNFDASMWEMMTALSAGACLVIGTPQELTPGPALHRFLRGQRISAALLPPSVLLALPDEPLPDLLLLVSGGEACPAEVVSRWGAGRRLFNAYGPTECTIYATLHECADDGQPPPIGRPVVNVRAYVLDPGGRPVAPGAVGELHIGGVGVARGYLNRPALTDERFLPDPFGAPGERLYRTGDLVEEHSDGVLVFRGRIDDQIKIRGFRIEPGEVEAALRRYPAVCDAVVIARGPVGDRSLIAYVVGTQPPPAAAELRRFLLVQLPAHMVPTRFVTLDALPLTPNGKVDRRALPEPPTASELPAPRTPVEARVGTLWAQVLGQGQAGAGDDFLLSGGDSLRGAQLLARLHEHFGVELTLAQLFECATLARLVECIEAWRAPAPPPAAPEAAESGTLGDGQQQLWLLCRLVPDRPLYQEAVTLLIDRPVEHAHLQRALDAFATRHGALRSRFPTLGGKPRALTDAPAVPLAFHDLGHLPESQREAEAMRLASAQLRRPLDLEAGPLWRACLLRLGPARHRLELALHHLIVDATSLSRLLLAELPALYEAIVAGQELPFSAPAPDYARFVHYTQALAAAELPANRAYWLRHLEALPPLPLPTDHPRAPQPAFRGGRHPFTLPPALHRALAALGARADATLFTTVLAAFKALLQRYADHSDIAVGTVAELRDRQAWQGLFGYCLNTLVLRTDLGGDPSFLQLLARVRSVTLDAFAHKSLPFNHLVDLLHPQRQGGVNPLFQVSFTLEPSHPHPPLWRLDTQAVHNGCAKFDLSLQLAEHPQGLRGFFDFDADLFEPSTIARMAGHLRTLLEAVAADPEQRLSHLPLLSAAEVRQLQTWNASARPFPADRCFHYLFEEQVRRTPEATALVAGHQRLSYRDLNRRANRLAHRLIDRGIGPENLVGICLPRSPETVVAVLATLKAGAAYLPLDPAYPPARLAWMLGDAHPALLLTRSARLPALASLAAGPLLDLDTLDLDTGPADNPPNRAAPHYLAYVIYTSGSTGNPKGVMIEHRGLCNLATAQSAAFALGPDDRVLQFASFSFDASVSEMAMTLVAGAAIHIPPPDIPLVGEMLLRQLQEDGITVVTLPPSILATLPSAPLAALRCLVIAGEACPAELVARWAAGRRFINAYGPTETTVCATFADCTTASGPPPIGYPLANTRVHVLDRNRYPCPIGVPGELFIGGVGLARGYLNRPELTAERFVPDPFQPGTGERLYRTGDRVRRREDGSLEFLGRLDHQVKIRGYRIEPGEIEAVLRGHPDVRNAVVVARGEQPDQRLLAFIVPKTPESDHTCRPPGKPRPDACELWPSVAEYHVYDEFLYYAMTHDERRNRSYQVAIERQVSSKVVVDIGTGKDAILARLCAAAGARRVYAVETSSDAFAQASALVVELGLSDTIIPVLGDATDVELPEPVDVCVSEIVGPIGGCEGAAVILNSARRLLKKDAVVIPARSTTLVAAVTLPEELRQPRFCETGAHYANAIFEQVGYPFDLRVCVKGFPKTHLISESAPFEHLDFSGVAAPEFRRSLTLTITRPARLDGFLLWLNLHTAEGELIDILEHEHCWLPVFFPVFYPGVEVDQGDRIEATGYAVLSDNRLKPDYGIEGRLLCRNAEPRAFSFTSHHHAPVLRANPFHRELLAADGRPNGNALQPATRPLEAEIRAHLRRSLPNYMFPSAILLLQRLPTTSNGKIDRSALADTSPIATGHQSLPASPGNGLEQRIAEIWCRILQLPTVAVDDNFFDLGGNSLQMLQVHEELNALLGKDLPLVLVFRFPTVAALAGHLSAIGPTPNPADASPGRATHRLKAIRTRKRPLGG